MLDHMALEHFACCLLFGVMKTALHAVVHRNLDSLEDALEEDKWLRNYLPEIVSSDHPDKSA
jgi:hypothetical protein